jgi:hypothetical protein
MAIVLNIIADALTEIGVLQASETPTAGDTQLALLRLQNQLDAWAADRLTLSAQLRTTFVLLSGTSAVTLGPVGATVIMARPVWLNAVNYEIPGTSPAVEVPIAIMDEDSFSSLSIKQLSSALPTQCFYQTEITTVLGTLFFWPKVSQNVTIDLYSPQQVGVPATINTVLIGPPGYAEAFMYQLALRLCRPFGIAIPPDLMEMATRAFANMKRPNVTPGLLGIDAALVPSSGGGYNILSDNSSGR